MLIHVEAFGRVLRLELTKPSTEPEPEEAPVPVETQPPMAVYTPDYDGFVTVPPRLHGD